MIVAKRRGLLSQGLSGGIAATFVLILTLVTLSGSVQAQPADSLFVYGRVVDSADTPISGASVTVSIKDKTAVRSDPDGTDSNGWYAISADFTFSTDYVVGDYLIVEASCGLGAQTNQSEITLAVAEAGEALVWVDYTTAIPEFGSTLGLVLATFITGLVAVVVVGKKRTR